MPGKEVKFAIDLVPNSTSIFIAPYCMQLLELRELKE